MTTRKAGVKKAAKKAARKPAQKRTAKKKAPGASPAKPSAKRFRALVERGEGSVCAISINFDVEQAFGQRGRVPVRGTLGGAPFRGSLFPMGGRHFMVVNRHLRAAAGVSGGETVAVVMERDDEPRTVEPPADFARALRGDEVARAAWDKLSYTHRREHVEHIEEAKKPETRLRRIERSIERLAAGRKEPR